MSECVSSLTEGSMNPFSCISLSPSREYAVAAAKDTLSLLRIDSRGIKSLRKLKISQYFQTSVTNEHRSQNEKVYGDVRDTFKLGVRQPRSTRNTIHINATVTAVSWSPPQIRKHKVEGEDTKREYSNSLVAAAGSNGVICIWNAKQTFFSEGSGESSTLANQQPEAILGQEHTRAINNLTWHPKRPGMLLSASQDATIKLWERREVAQKKGKSNDSKRRFGFFNMAQNQSNREFLWICKGTFEPKSEAIREISWSKFQDDVFALVTVSGSLVVYSMHVTWKFIVKIAAHTGEATSLDWHPTRPFIIATGGAGDRCVKVWDVESDVNMKAEDNVMSVNSNTWNTTRSEMSAGSTGSTETDKSSHLTSGFGSIYMAGNVNTMTGRTLGGQAAGRFKTTSKSMQHVTTIGSSVTKVRWRPPAFVNLKDEPNSDEIDKHDSMFAVATARLTSAGGSGVISLWSTNRPFMPLSVVEGHTEGAVADFVWMQSPEPTKKNVFDLAKSAPGSHASQGSDDLGKLKSLSGKSMSEQLVIRSGGHGDVESTHFEEKEKIGDRDPTGAIWQHVLSVGRDGKCLLQSFVRGDRPISRVPSSCFAIANLSPFQRGYGSLQVFSVQQQVPNSLSSDYELTALRQDSVTAKAPGVFKEVPVEKKVNLVGGNLLVSGRRLPESTPALHFNILDQGPLDEEGLPLTDETNKAMMVAPEVVHLSRFASSYKLYIDTECPTRVSLCLYNADIAHGLQCGPLSRMWRSIAEMLGGSNLDELPSQGAMVEPMNVMHFVLLPTLKTLLLERADAGDVQTCVALCEVLQVIEPEDKTRIPGLSLNLVREWYLSYIDLLHQMCLFTSATFLIKNCSDPFIGALNQQSTTIHESCPGCGKAIEASGSSPNGGSVIRACQNCRLRIGNCFLCHEPVKGVFVWCPGCGHGGHLEHALQWFGGPIGPKAREVCPTGCGHRCNLVQSNVSAFPRTDSLRCLPTAFESSPNNPPISVGGLKRP